MGYLCLEATFGPGERPAGFQPALMMWSGDGRLDVLAGVAKLARDGGQLSDGTRVEPGTITILDFSRKSTETPLFMKNRVEFFRQSAPGVRVGIRGYRFGELNARERNITPSIDDKILIGEDCRAKRNLVRSLDALFPEFFLHGPMSVDRDLAFIGAMTQVYKSHYPQTPVYPLVCGAFHPELNVAGAVIPEPIARRYAASLRASCDGLVLWGRPQDGEILAKRIRSLGSQEIQ